MTQSSSRSCLLATLFVAVSGCRQFAEPKPPALVVSPSALSFTARAGGRNPPPQYLIIAETDAEPERWTASADAPWVDLFSRGDTLPYFLTVAATTSGMGVGGYTASITITRPSDGAVRTVPVALTLLSVTPLAGRWAGVQDSLFVLLTLTESGGQVAGFGTLAPPSRPVHVSGTYADPGLSLILAGTSDTTTLAGSFVDDNSIAATLAGPQVANVRLIVYRQ